MYEIEKYQQDLVVALRSALHNNAEISGQERKTKALLMAFLREHCSLEVLDCGRWFYCAHREENSDRPAIALRADYDGVAAPEGGARHLCGHDGHSAVLCAVALAIEGKQLGRNVFLLFQPAEETGEGAPVCCELFERETIDEIYGAHNLPGVPLGQVRTKADTFACASRGLSIVFQGTPTHAAYPELGISPSLALGQLLVTLSEITQRDSGKGVTRCTVIGTKMGEKAFGMAPSRAEIWITLRGEYDTYISTLETDILAEAAALAKGHQLGLSWEIHDNFPATCNHPASAQKILDLCGGVLLEEPMRWSEDFGWYLQRCKGAFFGIGAGETHPPLHTDQYEYPDSLLSVSTNAFLALLQK